LRVAGAARWMVVVLGGVLLCIVAMPAAAQEQPPASTAPPPDIANEYRITAYPSYPITEKLAGFGYVGYVSKPDADYTSIYLGTGTFYRPTKAIQIWVGLIGVATDQDQPGKSNLLELRPFTGVKFMGGNSKKWHYYNWTRWEIRYTETKDTGDWTTVHRFRNQSRLEFPLASLERAWTPKTFYAFSDVEPIWRSDTDQIDPLRLRAGIGYIASPKLLVEFQYYAQYTRPNKVGLAYTDNIIRVNFKLMTKRGVLGHRGIRMLLDGGIDD
jgi:hypothetical protein